MMNGVRDAVFLPRHPRAAAEARRVLARVAPDGRGDSGTARLLLSEVVSNAVRYARGEEIQVVISFDGTTGAITGAVFDGEPVLGAGTCPRRRREREQLAESGRGFDLLDMLAETWGVATVGGAGKWVWFCVPSGEEEA
ncbi:ATP-binding protein [Streptomyces zhihengii]|nr:ATP-binding protein [Streptomyces zhihengii]